MLRFIAGVYRLLPSLCLVPPGDADLQLLRADPGLLPDPDRVDGIFSVTAIFREARGQSIIALRCRSILAPVMKTQTLIYLQAQL
jgi:hypothetical protein